MIKRISISEYFERKGLPIIDVRTPSEFNHAHFPGAVNISLFSDEERIKIGTIYKQIGREKAILLGFDFVGPKWSSFIRHALEVAPKKEVAVHCWRGGMRSAAMAWALDFYGFDVFVIEGGYKSYRNWVLQQFEKEYPFIILGGMTGSHKTAIIEALKKSGEQSIDLEGLAQHLGSAYGSMNKLIQPSQEQFENFLALHLSQLNPCKRIWLEDESRNIGKCTLPNQIYEQMRAATVMQINLPKEDRVSFLVEEYGTLDKNFLIDKTESIKKRLGPQHTKSAVQSIEDGRMEDFIKTVLVYYDKTYRRGLSKREEKTVHPIHFHYESATQATEIILNFIDSEL